MNNKAEKDDTTILEIYGLSLFREVRHEISSAC